MSLTIAQLNSAVFLALGSPDPAVCDPLQIHYAVRQAVTLLTKQMRAADTNQPLSVTAEFTPTSSPYEITSLISKGTVAWVEVEEGSRWKTVRAVNKAFLEQAYDAELAAVAIYSDETGAQFIDFSSVISSDSTRVFRIWYDKDAVLTTRATAVLIPDSFAPYVELLAQNSLIPRIKLARAAAIESEEQRRIIGLELEAWDGIIAQNTMDLRDWRFQWRREIHRNRTSQNFERLPSKSGGNFYGG